ncbi:MAG: CHAT domain-containing protein [Chitinophagaceae bacterium]
MYKHFTCYFKAIFLCSCLLLNHIAGSQDTGYYPETDADIDKLVELVEKTPGDTKTVAEVNQLLEETKATYTAYFHAQQARLTACLSLTQEFSNHITALKKITQGQFAIYSVELGKLNKWLADHPSGIMEPILDSLVYSLCRKNLKHPYWDNQPVLAYAVELEQEEENSTFAYRLGKYLLTRPTKDIAVTPDIHTALVGYLDLAEYLYNSPLSGDSVKENLRKSLRVEADVLHIDKWIGEYAFEGNKHTDSLAFLLTSISFDIIISHGQILSYHGLWGHYKYLLYDFMVSNLLTTMGKAKESGFATYDTYRPILIRTYEELAKLCYTNGDYHTAIVFADNILNNAENDILLAYKGLCLKAIGTDAELDAHFKKLIKEQETSQPADINEWIDFYFWRIFYIEANYERGRFLNDYNITPLLKILQEKDAHPEDSVLLNSSLIYSILNSLSLKNAKQNRFTEAKDLLKYVLSSYAVTDNIRIHYLTLQLKLHEKPDTVMLRGLLTKTGKIINTSFLTIHPDERLQVYRDFLLPYFTFYHTMLANGHYDKKSPLMNEMLLQSKLLKRSLAEIQVYREGSNNDDLKNLPAVYKSIHRAQIASEFYSPGSKPAIDAAVLYQRLINNKILGEKIAGNELTNTKSASFQQDEVLVEFIVYKDLLRDSLQHYMAYVTTISGTTIHYVFSEKQLLAILSDQRNSRQLASLSGSKRGLSIRPKKETTSKQRIAIEPGEKDKLSALIFTKLRNQIKDKKKLSFIPDGYLHRVSFASLILDDKFLFNRFSLQQLTHSFAKENTIAGKTLPGKALLIGNIDYGQDNGGEKRLFRPGIVWSKLKGTLSEINNIDTTGISNNWKIKLAVEDEFTDTLLNTASSYDVIHIASHGFYFTAAETGNYYTPSFASPFVLGNPDLRSGILATGANKSYSDSIFVQGYEGIIHGYELSSYDFSNCRLVTLSACETALGDITNNVGVTGIQRALKIAGANDILIALWEVPDKETSAFMQYFYQVYFKGVSAGEALKQTQSKFCKIFPVNAWGAFTLLQ